MKFEIFELYSNDVNRHKKTAININIIRTCYAFNEANTATVLEFSHNHNVVIRGSLEETTKICNEEVYDA